MSELVREGTIMILQNLHTHSIYCDGKDTIDEMVQTAIDKGFQILGFSGHGYNLPIDTVSMNDENQKKYMEAVLNAKTKYKDQITIYLGIEEDLIGRVFSHDEMDYIIGSVHFVPYKDTYIAVDESEETFLTALDYYGSFIEYAKAYYKEVKQLGYRDEVDIIGHLDLLMKYNENEKYFSFSDPEYLKIVYDCVDVLIENSKIIEVNTGAIARGYRSLPYPYKNILEYIHLKDGMICLNSDCHNRKDLDIYFKESLEYILECGFDSLMIKTEDGFRKTKIK